MTRVAIVEKYPTNYDYNSIFPFLFKKYSLVNRNMDKVLKKDIILDIDELKTNYDYIIVVGKEPSKFIAGITSVTEYQGFLWEDKYIPIVNPLAVKMKPSLETSFNKSVKRTVSIINEEVLSFSQSDVVGITEEKEVIKYLNSISKYSVIAMDTETSSLYPREGYVLGISISHKKEQGVYIDSLCITDEIVEKIQNIVNSTKVIFHNAKFDMKFLKYHFGLTFPDWEDTMLEHYVLDETEGSHGLKQLALKYTNLGDYDNDLDKYKSDFCKKHKVLKRDFSYDLIPFDIMYPYAALDTAATYELHNKFINHISDNKKLNGVYTRLLKEGTEFLIDMEENGIPINIELCNKYIVEINEEITSLTQSLYNYEEVKQVEEHTGALFNTNSTAHKSYLFFTVLGLPVHHLTEKGNPSTDAETIESLAELSPLPEIINTIMKLKKIKSTYLEKFIQGVDADNRLRTGFNLHTTTSGRLSSSGKLNAQQLPRKDKRPKKCIEARKGYKIVSQDLKTAEMYVASVLSGDKNLQQIFIDGVDYHGKMSCLKFNLPCTANEVKDLYPDKRQDAKTISFEILYKLNYKEPALEGFPTLKKWLQRMEKQIKRDGFIYSGFGRKRRLQDVFSPSRQEAQHCVRSGINSLVQSVSSDINLLAAIDMQKWIKENGFEDVMLIWGLVHDSILAEVADEFIDMYLINLAKFTQMDRAGMSIPGHPIGLDTEVGNSYAEVKEYEAKLHF